MPLNYVSNDRTPFGQATDEQLAQVEAELRARADADGDLEPPAVSAALALQMVSEVRRLRADAADLANGAVASDGTCSVCRACVISGPHDADCLVPKYETE